MFLDSVMEGIKILVHWQVWGAILIYVAIIFTSTLAIGLLYGEGESGGRMAAGCLFHTIGQPVLHGALMGMFVLFLLPVLFGNNYFMSWSLASKLIWPVIWVSISAVLSLVFVIIFVPIIGGLIAESQTIQSFIVGAFIIRFLTDPFLEQVGKEMNITDAIYPGLWEALGYVIIAGILGWLFMLGIGFLIAMTHPPYRETSLPAMVIATSFSLLGSFLPLFMYCQYIKLSLIKLGIF